MHIDPHLDGALRTTVDGADAGAAEKAIHRLRSGMLSGLHRARERELGLPPRVVRLVPHSPSWAEFYLAEACLLRATIGQHIIDIQHVGSTAIRNIAAKPIIDILVGLNSLDVADLLIESLSAAGYVDLGCDVVPSHHVFAKGPNRSFLLHAVEHEGPAWLGLIAFRDVLIRHPEIASKYDRLKARLSSQFENDRAGYTSVKGQFIEQILKEGVLHEG